MNWIIIVLALCFVLQIGVILSFVLGFVLTEKVKPLINVKPFNCRPCLTFWLTLLTCSGTALAFLQFCGVSSSMGRIVCVGAFVVGLSLLNFLVAKLNTVVEP